MIIIRQNVAIPTYKDIPWHDAKGGVAYEVENHKDTVFVKAALGWTSFTNTAILPAIWHTNAVLRTRELGEYTISLDIN